MKKGGSVAHVLVPIGRKVSSVHGSAPLAHGHSWRTIGRQLHAH